MQLRSLAARAVALALFLSVVPTVSFARTGDPSPPSAAAMGYDAISADSMKAHERFLASNAMQGREAASPQLEIAGDYIASVLSLAGVAPAGDASGPPDKRDVSYFQNFEVAEVTPVSQALSLETRAGETVTRYSYEPKVDFTANITSSISRTAPLVFVGYGYTVKDANWDDYAGVDVKGKIAVAIDGAPGKGSDASWFYKPENRRRYFGRFASIYKAMAAAQAGAVAIIIIDSPNADAPLSRELAENKAPKDDPSAKNVHNLPPRREMVLANEEAGAALHGGFSGVSTVKVTERVAQNIFEGTNESTASLQKKIDSTMKPASFPLVDRKMTIDVTVDSRILSTRNVLGMIPGSDPALAGEIVMIGAHYDHEGARGGYVWPGADDNASGTSGVLEIARAFAKNPAKPKRTVVFAFWSSEEKGLLGSKHYVDHPLFPLDKTVTYINLDMIGRDGDPSAGGDPHAAVGGPVAPKKVDPNAPKIDPALWMSVEGSLGYNGLETITYSAAKQAGLVTTYKQSDIRFAASDHLYFARKNVPIISYFDGGNDDYHQPTDTPEKLNYSKMEKVARTCYLTLWDLANAPARPVKTEPEKKPDTPSPSKGFDTEISESALSASSAAQSSSLALPNEKHLRNIRQLTNGGENAEAYFSFDNKWLSFQSTHGDLGCDQIFIMKRDGTGLKMVSTGKGRTTCSYFLPGGKQVLYASTHLGSPDCPPKPDFSKGYTWALYKDYDIFVTDLKTGKLTRLTSTPGYDAEATISPDGKRVVFTSVRDGDLELYSMKLDGTDVKRLTNEPGYDGGAFYSPDSKMIVYRANHPDTPEALAKYKTLLADGLIEPRALEIWVMNADGTGKRQVTSNGKANFAPFFHPDGKRIIFASNMDDPKGRNFDLYMINIDGTGLERITFNDTFDGFPMFTSDGKYLVFASNRHDAKPGETNVFLAEWVK